MTSGAPTPDGAGTADDARAWPADVAVRLSEMTGGEDLGDAKAGETASPEVPDAPAEAIDESSLGDRVADALADTADRLLADDDLSDSDAGGPSGNDSVTVAAPSRPATTKRSGEHVMASPVLTMPRVTQPEAIVLFVHGGDVQGTLRMNRSDPAYLRMVPFARDVERRSHGRIGGALLRLAVRGWNDPEKPAVEDARWAMGELRRRYPGVPIAIAGHSMGGRVALDLAAVEHLAAVVALAPWAADAYDASLFDGIPVLGIHGRHDTVTDPAATKGLVERIEKAGGDAEFVSMPGWHAMLLRAPRWHALTSTFLIDRMLDPR